MNYCKYDYLIVGAGLFGASFAYFAKKNGKRCIVIDKRPHIGGNIYCENIEGINVHKYGAHIFHTSNSKIWNFVNSLVPFNRYTNAPVALAPDGNLYNLPFNMNTFYGLWKTLTPEQAEEKLRQQRAEAIEKMHADGVSSPRNLEEQALTLIGRDVYNLLIKGYTRKQWGRPCDKLPPFIIRRLPIRLSFDNNYFNDSYQGIPIGGYNPLINSLLSGIDTRLSTDFFENREMWSAIARKIVFTGRIDEYYDYQFGNLEYRTVRFDTEILDLPNFQGNAVVNYTSETIPYTRIIEHKHFEQFGESVYNNPKTVISREYPMEWENGMEPFYPVNDSVNSEKYQEYRELSEKDDRVLFGGRLAEYKYYDMAPIIERAIDMASREGLSTI